MENTDFSQLPDETIISKMKNGNELAFTNLYNKYWKRLLAYTLNIVNDKGLAEDVLHDVFTNLWTNRKNLEISNLENYLFVATRNRSISLFRKVKFTELDEVIIGKLLPFSIEADANLIKDDLRNTIEEAIKDLPQKCRVIFYMSRYQQYSNEEIATHFNISLRTVENQLSVALRHLKGAIGMMVVVFYLVHLP